MPGPAFHRNVDPSVTLSGIETSFTAGFQPGQRSIVVSTSQTSGRRCYLDLALPYNRRRRVVVPAHYPSRSARSKKPTTRRSYSFGRALIPPTCPLPGTSQIIFGCPAAA